MKKTMGYVTGKLSLSILTVIVLLVSVLAGVSRITSTTKASEKASSKVPAANSATPSPKDLAAPTGSVASTKGSAASPKNRAATPLAAPARDLAAAQEHMGRLPLIFEPNLGQTDKRAQFVARSSGYTAFLTGSSSATFAFRGTGGKTDVLSFNLAGANTLASAKPEASTNGYSNYYIGNDRSKWLEHVPNYAKVRYSGVYPGVDMVYQGNDRNLRYDFEVRPGADPKAIRMSYSGAKNVSIDEHGNLVVAMAAGQLVGSKPYIYQEYGGAKHVVEGGYTLTAQNDVAFTIGSYDSTQALVIDPNNTYGTYYGQTAGAGSTLFNAIAIDASQNIYAAGSSASIAFPAVAAAQAVKSGGTDAVVVKLNENLTSAPLFSTYWGGGDDDVANGVAVFGGFPVIVGTEKSNTSFPTAGTSLSSCTGTAQHAFVARFNGSGAIQSSTCLTGGGTDLGNAVAVDASGNIHIAGATGSGGSSFLTAIGAPTPATTSFQATNLSTSVSTNAFYVELNPTASAVLYGSLIGGYGTDSATAIAVDPAGNAYLGGNTNSLGQGGAGNTGNSPFCANVGSPSFFPVSKGAGSNPGAAPGANPTCSNPFQFPGTPALQHGFVAEFNPTKAAAASLVYSILLGNRGGVAGVGDTVNAIAVDAAGNAYVGGSTFFENVADCSFNAAPVCNPHFGISPAPYPVAFGNTVFSAPGGPSVVSSILSIAATGAGYAAGDKFFIGAPVAGGAKAIGQVLTTGGGGSVTSVKIINQGSGYALAGGWNDSPLAVATSGTNGGGNNALTLNIRLAQVVTGIQTNGPFTDGFVVEINSSAAASIPSFNGITGSSPAGCLNTIASPCQEEFATLTGFAFPSLVYATLANGDETSGNGNTIGANGVVIGPAARNWGASSVNGIVVDALGQASFTGLVSQSSVGIGGTQQSAIMRRRIGQNGFMAQVVAGPPPNGLPVAPASNFLLTFNTPVVQTIIGGAQVTPAAAVALAVQKTGDIITGPVSSSSVNQVNVTNAGSGYGPTTVGVTFTGGGCTTEPSGAVALTSGSVSGISLVAPNFGGTGCTSAPTVAITSGIPSNVDLALPATTNNPFITITATGNGYAAGQVVTFSGGGCAVEPTGTVIVPTPGLPPNGNVTGINITGTGTGCSSAPTAAIPPPGTAGCTPITCTQATATDALQGTGAIAVAVLTGPPGAGTGIALDPITTNSCFAGFVGSSLPTATAGSPAVIPGTAIQSLFGPSFPSTDGIMGCVGFNDVVVTPLSLTFTQAVGSSTNPTSQSVTATVPNGVPAITLPSQITYTPGGAAGTCTTAVGPLAGVDGATHNWLSCALSGNSVVFSITPEASKLDPGQYTVTALLTASAVPPADNNGVTQTVTITLNVTALNTAASPSSVQVNTVVGGGFVSNLTANLTPGVGFADVGFNNKVINIPIITNVPFLPLPLSQGNVVMEVLSTNGQPVNSNATFPVLVPSPPAGNNGGLVAAAPPANAGIVDVNPVAGLPLGGVGCGSQAGVGAFVPNTAGTANKTLSNSNVCYIQVILPPTMLVGAGAGPFTGKFQLVMRSSATGGAATSATNFPSTAPVSSAQVQFVGGTGVAPVGNTATITITVNTVGGGLLINDPWISNTPPFFVTGPAAPPVPLAPFAVSAGFSGQITSDLLSGAPGNNPPFSHMQLDSRNLAAAQQTAHAAVTGGISATAALGFAIPLPFGPVTAPPIFTCTSQSPAIPAGVLSFPGSDGSAIVLPASNALVTATDFTLKITNPAAAGITSGAFASTITVTPDVSGAATAVSLPVCLVMGNNVNAFYESVAAPVAVPPAFDTGTIVTSLFLQAGAATQTIQVIATAVGPAATGCPGATCKPMGTPQFAPALLVPIPLTINAGDPANQTWMTNPAAPVNSGNEFDTGTPATGSTGTPAVAAACPATGSAAGGGGCATTAYRDLNLAPPLGQPAGTFTAGFVVTATGAGLLAGTTPNGTNTFTPTIPVTLANGPAVNFTCTNSDGTANNTGSCVVRNGNGTVFAVTLTGAGSGYTSAPTVTFVNGNVLCTTPPVAVAVINGAGNVTGITVTQLGTNCTSAPNVTLSAPQTAGGVTATAAVTAANISNGTIDLNFTVTTGSTVTSPAFTDVTMTPNVAGLTETEGSFFFSTAVFQQWIAAPTNSVGGCIPGGANFTQTLKLNGDQSPLGFASPAGPCTLSFAPGATGAITAAVLSSLSVGSYTAWEPITLSGGAAPNVTLVVVHLLVSNGPQLVLSSTNVNFKVLSGLGTTDPPNAVVNVSLSSPPAPGSGASTLTGTVVTAQGNGPPNWLQVAIGAGAAGPCPGPGGCPITLSTTPTPITISVLSSALTSAINNSQSAFSQEINAAAPPVGTVWNGTVTINVPGISNSPQTINVTVTFGPTPSLTFQNCNPANSVAGGPTPAQTTCVTSTGLPDGTLTGGTANFTIGQVNSLPTGFTMNLFENGGGDTVTLTVCNGTAATGACVVPTWLTAAFTQPSVTCPTPITPTVTSCGITPLTVTINPAGLTGTSLVASVRVTGTANETATFPVTLTIVPTPTIVLSPIPVNVPAITAGSTTTVPAIISAKFSAALNNPLTAPVTTTIGNFVGGAAGWLTVTAGNPATLSGTAADFSFTVNPTGLNPGNYSADVTFTTTTPSATATDTINIVIQGSLTSNPVNCTVVDLGSFVIGSPAPKANLTISSNPTGKLVSFQLVNVPNTAGACGVTAGAPATWLNVSPNSITTTDTVQVSISTGDQAIVNAANGTVLIGNVVITTPNPGPGGLNCASAQVATINNTVDCVETITYKVTIVSQPTPVLLPASQSLTFDEIKGGGGAPGNVLSKPITVSMLNAAAFANATVQQVNAPTGAPATWLTTSPANPIAVPLSPATATINVIFGNGDATLAAFPPGIYTASISITGCATSVNATCVPSAGTSPNPITVPVVIQVLAQPAISAVGDVTLNHTIAFTNPNANTSTVNVTLTTTTSFNDNFVAVYPWTATASVTTPAGGNWLKVTPGAGTTSNPTQAGQVNSFVISYDPTGLAAGTYAGKVSIAIPNTSNTPFVFNVTLVVSSTPLITSTPSSATLTAPVNGQPVSAPLAITSTGAGFTPPAQVTYTVGNITAQGNQCAAALSPTCWLTVSAGGTTPNTVTVTANPVITTGTGPIALQAGTYSGSFTMTSTNLNPATSTTVNIIFQVQAPTVIPTANTLPFSFTVGQAGSTPANATLAFKTDIAPGVNPVPFTAAASVSTPAGGNWLKIDKTSGTITTTTSVASTLTVTIDPTGLTAAGSPYSGSVVVTVPTAPGGTPQVTNSVVTIPVILTVHDIPTIQINGGTTATGRFDWTTGQPATAPTSLPFAVTLTGSDTITTTSSASWLVLTCSINGGPSTTANCASASTTSEIVTATINLADPTLPAATTTATITVKGTLGEQNALATITFAVTPRPTLTASAIPVTTVLPGAAAPITVTSSVVVNGTLFNPTSLPVTATVTAGASWLAVDPTSPTSVSNTAGTFKFIITPGALPPCPTPASVPQCSFNGSVTITTTGNGITPPLTVVIAVPLVVQGTLTITPTLGTDFGPYTVGSVPNKTLALQVTTNPAGVLVSLSSSATWLTVSPPQANAPFLSTVALNTADLALQSCANPSPTTGGCTLTATITATAPANALNCLPSTVVNGQCTATQAFTVTVIVTPALTATPSTLTFNLIQGGGGTVPNVPTQNIAAKFSAPATPASTFNVSVLEANNQSTTWITAPAGPITGGTTAVNVPVTIDITKLPAGGGTFFATVTLTANAPATGTVTVPVTVNVFPQPTLTVAPSSVTLNHVLGVTTPNDSKTVAVTAPTSAPNPAYPFTATANQPWVVLTGATGTTPGSFTIGYNLAALPTPTGTFSATVTVTSANAAGSPATVNVTLNVAPVPALQAAPPSVSISALFNNPAATTTVNVTSSDANTTPTSQITYTIGNVTSAPAGWLSVTGAGTTPNTLTVTANPVVNGTPLQVGAYTGTFTLIPSNANLASLTIPVTFNVTQVTLPTVSPNPLAMQFNFTIGGPAESPQTLTLKTDIAPITSPLNFTATPSSTPAGWLLVNASTGPVTGTLTTAGTALTISINPAGLNPTNNNTNYFGSISVAIPNGANGPQVNNPSVTIPVILTVHTQPFITIAPNAVTFNYTTGQPNTAPPTNVLNVVASSNQDTVTVSANQPWVVLVCSVAGATVPCAGIPAANILVTSSINLATAPAAGGTATITAAGVFGATDAASTAVTFNASALPAPGITATPNPIPTTTVAPGAAAPITVSTSVKLTGQPFNPTSLPVSVTVTNGASWLAVAPGNPSSVSGTAGTFSFVITPGALAPGNFNGAVTITTTGGIAPPLTVVVAVPLVVQGTLTMTPNSNSFPDYTVGSVPTTVISMPVATNPSGVLVSLSSSATWLTVSPPQANAPFTSTVALNTADAALQGCPGGASSCVLTATITGTAAQGSLNCLASLVVNNQCTATQTFTVKVVVTPVLTATPGSLTFNLIQGGGGVVPNVLTQNIAAKFSAPAVPPSTFTVSVLEATNTTTTWITAGPSPVTGGVNPVNVPVTINLANLPAAGGSFFATVTLSAVAPAVGTVTIPVTVNVFPQPILTTSTTSVTLNHVLSVTSPNQVATINVTAPTSAPNPAYPFTATTATPWIVLTGATGGSTPGTFTISYDLTKLTGPLPTVGQSAQFTGTVTVTSTNAASSPTTVNVTLNVAAVPVLTPAPPSLSMTAIQGLTATQTVSLSSTDHSTTPTSEITYTVGNIVSAPAGWLAVTAGGTTPSTVTVTSSSVVSGTTLAVGAYNGSFVLTPNNPLLAPVTVTVTFNVTPPGFTVTPASLTFSMAAAGSLPATQTLGAVNNQAGTTPITFTASVSSVPTGWLTISGGTAPVTGTTPATETIGIAASAASLTPGTYTGLVQFTQPGVATPLSVIQVTLTVAPDVLSASATSLSFASNGIVAAPPQTVNVTSSPANVAFTALATVTSGPAGWLTVAPTQGTTPAALSVSAALLPQGIYTGTITISSANAVASIVIPVTYTVGPPSQCILQLSASSAPLTDTGTTTNGFIPLNSQTFTITPTETVPGGAACTLASWTVTSSTPGTSANWLAVTGGATGSGVNPATVTFTAMGNPHSTARSATLTVNGTRTTPASAVFTVSESAMPGTLNQRAIRAFYQQLLGRDPDSGGYSFWNNQCATSPGCLGQLVDQFMESAEGQSTDMAGMIAYQGATGAAPSFSQWLGAVAPLRTGAQTPTGLLTQVTPGLTVANLYANLLNRTATGTELGQTLAAAYIAITTSAEFKNQTTPAGADHSNFLWVRLVYYVTLSRDPDAGGLQFWIGQANTLYGSGIFYGSSTAAANARLTILGPGTPLQGFVGSPEFQALFN